MCMMKEARSEKKIFIRRCAALLILSPWQLLCTHARPKNPKTFKLIILQLSMTINIACWGIGVSTGV